MRKYTLPKINTADGKKWYIEFSFQVPETLLDFYPRKTVRFKKYGDLNKVELDERHKYAEELRKEWLYALEKLGYDPFAEKIKALEERFTEKSLSAEERRRNTLVADALNLFIRHKEGEVEDKTVTTYQNTVNWLNKYFTDNKLEDLKISEVTRLHIATALKDARKERKWKSNTTYNKELEFCQTIFNWLELEEYIIKNPARNKLTKLTTKKGMHTWYDRETAKVAKDAMKGHTMLLRACQFTYWLMIRSKKELRALKISDIDQKLKRIRFRVELSKNKTEQYRDYSDEFQAILDEMKLHEYPKHYFVFGMRGLPADKPCGHNAFSKQWETIRTKIGLDKSYTIYGWKHTKIIHCMMQGMDGYQISHMARHSDMKTTEFYKKEYDFTLVNIYDQSDLTF